MRFEIEIWLKQRVVSEQSNNQSMHRVINSKKSRVAEQFDRIQQELRTSTKTTWMNHRQNVQNNIDANIQKKMMQDKIIETSTVAWHATQELFFQS